MVRDGEGEGEVATRRTSRRTQEDGRGRGRGRAGGQGRMRSSRRRSRMWSRKSSRVLARPATTTDQPRDLASRRPPPTLDVQRWGLRAARGAAGGSATLFFCIAIGICSSAATPVTRRVEGPPPAIVVQRRGRMRCSRGHVRFGARPMPSAVDVEHFARDLCVSASLAILAAAAYSTASPHQASLPTHAMQPRYMRARSKNVDARPATGSATPSTTHLVFVDTSAKGPRRSRCIENTSAVAWCPALASWPLLWYADNG